MRVINQMILQNIIWKILNILQKILQYKVNLNSAFLLLGGTWKMYAWKFFTSAPSLWGQKGIRRRVNLLRLNLLLVIDKYFSISSNRYIISELLVLLYQGTQKCLPISTGQTGYTIPDIVFLIFSINIIKYSTCDSFLQCYLLAG